jgi:hypothetical protein
LEIRPISGKNSWRKRNMCEENMHAKEESMQGTHAGKTNHVRVRFFVRDCNG